MLARIKILSAVGLMAAATVAAEASAQDTIPRPEEVSEWAIASGQELFHGKGGCAACHGDRGVGTPEGPSLISGPWRLGDGSYRWLVQMTQHAGWGTRRRGGDPRPMRGPGVLDSAEVSQAAAYVWYISRAKTSAEPQP